MEINQMHFFAVGLLPHPLELGLPTVVSFGEHRASTDNFLGVFGHGSAPKLLLDAVTKHVCWPMHS